MSSIKSRDTKPEILLGKHLWSLGLRYRKSYRAPGRPDFAIVRVKIAVFCDGDFWHGNNWRLRKLPSLRHELRQYSAFWRRKIETNIKRDSKVNKELQANGWEVLRFWASDIERDPTRCAKQVLKTYRRKLRSTTRQDFR